MYSSCGCCASVHYHPLYLSLSFPPCQSFYENSAPVGPGHGAAPSTGLYWGPAGWIEKPAPRAGPKKRVRVEGQIHEMASVVWLPGFRLRSVIVLSKSGCGCKGIGALLVPMCSCFSAIVRPPVSVDCVFRFAFVRRCRFPFCMCSCLLRDRSVLCLKFTFLRYLFWAAAAAGAKPGQAPLFLLEMNFTRCTYLYLFYKKDAVKMP